MVCKALYNDIFKQEVYRFLAAFHVITLKIKLNITIIFYLYSTKGESMNNIKETSCHSLKHKDSKKMIFIEGNVGVGKTTFLRFLHGLLTEHVLYEPNEMWQDIEGYDLLGEFFKDQKRWAYTCQSYILMTRIDQMIAAKQEEPDKACLVERSIYSGRYVFAEVAQEIGNFNGLEWSLYKKVWDRELKRFSDAPRGFIYLRTPAEVCYERIIKRGRKEEEPVTMDYLKRIEEKHEKWLVKKEGIDERLVNTPVLILDFTYDFYNDENLKKKYIQEVKDFITKVILLNYKK